MATKLTSMKPVKMPAKPKLTDAPATYDKKAKAYKAAQSTNKAIKAEKERRKKELSR